LHQRQFLQRSANTRHNLCTITDMTNAFQDWFRKNRVSKDHDNALQSTLDEAKEQAEELDSTIHALEGRPKQKAVLDPKVMQDMRNKIQAEGWWDEGMTSTEIDRNLRALFGETYRQEAFAVSDGPGPKQKFSKEERARLEKPAKFDRCVEHVKTNNPGASAYAVCNAVLSDKSFAGMDDKVLHPVIDKAIEKMQKARDGSVYNLISRISANQRTTTTKASTFNEAWNKVKPR
jgi:hypothetical protein